MKRHSRKKWALINRLHLEGNSSEPHHFDISQPLSVGLSMMCYTAGAEA